VESTALVQALRHTFLTPPTVHYYHIIKYTDAAPPEYFQRNSELLWNNTNLYHLIRILCDVVEADESGDELAVEEVVGVVHSPQTPVRVVVWVWTHAEWTICWTQTNSNNKLHGTNQHNSLWLQDNATITVAKLLGREMGRGYVLPIWLGGLSSPGGIRHKALAENEFGTFYLSKNCSGGKEIQFVYQ